MVNPPKQPDPNPSRRADPLDAARFPASPGSGGGSLRDDAVAQQYEVYPYPDRDPRDEDRRLITGSPSMLAELDHYVFAGRLRARAQNGRLRVLVAGGGTGDALVMLAQQLADAGIDADLTYVDMSVAARRIAEARIARRGLSGIRFVTGSLLDVAEIAPGPYDYIDCCGVLHHLESPATGLRALKAQLSEDGGMGLMVYGTLGRTGVYHFHDMMARLSVGTDTADPKRRMALGRALYRSLPPTNWLRRNPVISDLARVPDADFYDTLMHTRDRSYTVPELDAFVRAADLAIAAFALPVRYRPATYLADPTLRARAETLPWIEQCALAELLSGAIKAHAFYAVPQARAGSATARPDDPAMIPVLTAMDGGSLAQGIAKTATVKTTLDGVVVAYPLPRPSLRVLAAIDNKRTLRDITTVLAQDDASWTEDRTLAAFQPVFTAFNALGQLFLRAPP